MEGAPIYTPVQDVPAVPAAPMPPQVPKAEGGVEVQDGPVKKWFEDINILDVSISALIVGSIIYVVNYYKYQMMLEKGTLADLRSRIDNMDNRLKQLQSANQGRKVLL